MLPDGYLPDRNTPTDTYTLTDTPCHPTPQPARTMTPPLPHRHQQPFIKTCGQTHMASVDCAAAYGARFVGFIFHQGSPRSISPERAAEINSCNMGRVGVFVRQQSDEIIPIMKQARLDYVQFHGRQSIDEAKAIGPQHIIRTLWPADCSLEELQQQIDEWAPYCAYYLLDAGSAGDGGTGRQLDVEKLDSLRFPHPWILAGGLSAETLPAVLHRCHPDGIDLNSGIEIAPGMKCPSKMLAAFSAVSQAC